MPTDPSNPQRVPASNEVSGHLWRLAQAGRLLRYCEGLGIDCAEVQSGARQLDLSPICDADGKIKPEAIDLAHAERW